jgi:hypothetical protein
MSKMTISKQKQKQKTDKNKNKTDEKKLSVGVKEAHNIN